MLIKKLTLNNYGLFKGEQSIELGSGVFFVSGIYEGFPERSNRAGKSTLIEAITYALFGSVRKPGKELDLIHKGEKEMSVTVEFLMDDGKVLTIKRGRTITNRAILEVSGFEGTKKSQSNDLLSLLNLNEEDFVNTYFFKQDSIHGIMDSKPAERAELFMRWLKLGLWEQYESKAQELLKAEQTKKVSLENLINSNKVNYGEYLARKKDIQEIKSELQSLQLSIDLQNQKIHDISSLVSNGLVQFKTFQSQITDKQQQAKYVSGVIQSCHNKLMQMKAAEDVLQTLGNEEQSTQAITAKIAEVKAECASLMSEIGSITQKTNELTKFLQSLNTFCGVCPVDSKECDKGLRIPNQKEDTEKQIEHQKLLKIHRDGRLKSISAELMDHESARMKIERENMHRLSVQGTLKDKDKVVKEHNEAKEELAKLSRVIANLETELQGLVLQTPDDSLSGLKVMVAASVARRDALLQEVGSQTALQEQMGKISIVLQKSEQELSQVLKNVDQYKILTSAFGRTGIPSVLMENKLFDVENTANLIISSVLPENRIQFLTRKNVESTGQQKDELNIQIWQNGQSIMFSQDSGGGKLLTTFAIRLALTKLLMESSSRCRFLVLDEIFGALDSVNRTQLSKLIFSSLSNLLGFSQIFVITHTPIGEFGTFKTIEVKRHGDYSTMRVV